MIDKQQIFNDAVKKYGFDAQLNQLQEECGELIVASNKLRRNNDVESMIDELADVYIMVNQIIQAMNIEDKVDDRVEFKLLRLKHRLKS